MALYDTVANIVNDAAIELGLPSVTDVYASTDQNVVQLRQALKAVGRDLMLMHPWRQLIKEFTLVTTSANAYDLPLDFSGVCEQSEWDRTNRFPVGGPLSPQEWQMVKAQLPNQTLNHLFFRVFDTTLEVWPQPPPTGRTVALEYVSRYWVKSSGQSSADKDAPTANTDTIVFDAHLVTRALKLAWQKAKGLDTAGAQADFDAAYEMVSNANAGAASVLPLWTRRRRFWGWMLGLALLGSSTEDSTWYGAPLGTASAATHLAFDVQPSNLTQGSSFSPVVQVSVRDSSNNLVTTPNYSITLTSGSTLTGTVTRSTVSGVATFTGLGVSTTGSSITLTATASTLTGLSNGFDCGPLPHLAFDAQPSNTTIGVYFSPTVQVSLRDASNVLIATNGVPITIAISAGGLQGTLTENTSGGIATFTNVGPTALETGATLSAAATGYTGATSSSFNVTLAYLAFTTQPTATTATPSTAPGVVVKAYDTTGAVVTGFNDTCTLAVLANGNYTTALSGNTAAFSSGVATFSSLVLQHIGTTVRLQATSAYATAAQSTTFDVSVGAFDHLGWVASPPTTVEQGVALHQFTTSHKSVAVGCYDANGNLCNPAGSIFLYLYNKSGASYSADSLLGTFGASGGIAYCDGTHAKKNDSNTHMIGAAAAGVADLHGPDFTFTNAGHTQVSAINESNWTAAIAPTLQGQLLNTDGSPNASAGTTLTASGTVGGTTTAVTNGGGLASFGSLVGAAVADASDSYVTLSGSGSPAVSNAFNLFRPILQFDVEPQDVASGGTFGTTVKVSIRDSRNSLVSINGISITVSITAGSAIVGTATRTTSSGVATFTSLGASGVQGGVQLTATATSYKTESSNAFRVT